MDFASSAIASGWFFKASRRERVKRRAIWQACRLIEGLESRVLLSAGALDTTFGTDGQSTITFPTGQSINVVRDSLVQPDGKIVVTGESFDPTDPGSSDFAIARLNPDGSADTTFNNGAGIFVFPSPGNVDEGSGVAMQSDGKLVVSATFGETRTDRADYGLFAVGRFNADGTLDTGFGDQGASVIFFNQVGTTAEEADAADVLVGPDDKITLLGYAKPDPSAIAVDLALARLNADGTTDTTFGNGGKVLTSVSGDNEVGLSGAFDATGNIILAGTGLTTGSTSAHFITTRFLPNGAVDTSFGNGGIATTEFGNPGDAASIGAADAVAVQPDGEIVVGGLSAHADAAGNPTLHVALARLNPDGSPDTTFGDFGQIESDIGAYTSINKLLIDSQGRIIASGLSAPTVDALNAKQFDPFVAQYTPDGELDPTFGNGGSVTITSGPAAAPASSRLTPADLLASAQSAVGITPADAPSDTSQEQAAVFQKQAAIVVALRDKLLVLSNSNDQLTAARLIGNGGDLAAGTVSGIKAFSVLARSKARITVPVSNVGNEALSGTVVVTVALSADGTTVADTAGSVSHNFKLKPGAGKTYNVKFAYPAGLPDGSYYVLAVVNGSNDVNAGNDAGFSPAPVTVAMPFVDLGGTFGAVPTLVPGAKTRLLLNLQNAGNIPAKGSAQVALLASTDTTADAADLSLSAPATFKVNIKQSATKLVKIPLRLPDNLPPGNYFLIATINDSGLGDNNLANNVLITPTAATIV